jgi:chromosomal replication initiation ATPase DnaA
MIPIHLIAQRVADYYQVRLDNLRAYEKGKCLLNQTEKVARNMALLICKREGWSASTIGEYFKLPITTVQACINKIQAESTIYERLNQVADKLSA